MIDIHCHILPGVDDGPKTKEESILMAREAVNQGIETIIATPHHRNNTYVNSKKAILRVVDEFNTILQNEQIPLTILPGQETRIFGEILEDYNKEEILTLNNSNYLFLEFPSSSVPRYAERLLYEIQLEGLNPIIVHPERNKEILDNPNILYNLVKNGALTQVTAASLAGFFGKSIKKFSYQLIENNLTHFVASDAHNIHNRSFKLNEAYDTIEQEYGIDSVYLFKENAEMILDGKLIFKEVPQQIKKKKLFGIF
ncbi:tyrosine protein phosphatase [Niallia taxi]|uniref:tyrosine-protein phosphatase n=1 Tax=Niallia taxi TaxID=2499688 RepID=UPI002E1DAA0B|nr:CpsB/CapC family capsule biosynthesis tyrosine phosphatase [Niallia taxi]MED4054184.1 tyrosine protein phosphatase [Niallia taxi]MED4118296.1 tyrosine protein phosphatase [Niallia taxi]